MDGSDAKGPFFKVRIIVMSIIWLISSVRQIHGCRQLTAVHCGYPVPSSPMCACTVWLRQMVPSPISIWTDDAVSILSLHIQSLFLWSPFNLNQDGQNGWEHISNNSSFRQKDPGVLDGSDSSDGTSYPLTENYTLPVAQATGRVAKVPPLLCSDVYGPSEGHVCYTLRRGCSYAEAVYTTPGDIKSYLVLIVQQFSILMHSVCILIYVSI